MAIVCTINYNDIDQADILNEPQIIEQSTNEGKLIASTMVIELDNTDPTKYDDRYVTSIFYGTNFYGDPVTLRDDNLDKSIFQGTINKITVDDEKVTVEAYNNAMKLMTTVCEYTNSINKTAADIIYEIMTDVAGISEDDIDLGKFVTAQTIHTANSVYLTLSYALEDNIFCIDVINEICRMCQIDIYCIDNKMYIRQWEAYAGELGTEVKNKNIISGSYKHWSDDSKIINEYKIAYGTAAVSFAADSNADSQDIYGVRALVIPDSDLGTTIANYKIIFRNQTAAEWAGGLAISRYSNMIKKDQSLRSPATHQPMKTLQFQDSCFLPLRFERLQMLSI